jgi:hypothetical protein
MAREYFTVDLRGLRAALAARAAERRMTESDVLRSALAVALDADPRIAITTDFGGGPSPTPPTPHTPHTSPTPQVKLSVRLTRLASQRLDRQARAAGLSRGAYLSRLIDGAPPVTASADRKAAAAALSQSSAELAVLSRDINHLTQLVRRGAMDAALQYRERLDHLDVDVRSHLDKVAAVLAELAPARTGTRRAAPAAVQRNSP